MLELSSFFENRLKSPEKVCKNEDFCEIAVSSEKDNVLEFNQYMRSDKMPYIIYADIESLIKKIDGCSNNPESSSSAKIGGHIPCVYSMSTISAFDHIENKYTLYRGKDCMKTFCESLREQDARNCYICGKRILKKLSKSINYCQV